MRRSVQGVVVILSLLLPSSALASPITVTGTFTSFTSWVFAPPLRPARVNGTPLISGGGAPVGQNSGGTDYFLSDPIVFPGGSDTTRLEFAYDDPPNLTNVFEFIPATGLDVSVGDTFQVGTFRFTNGQWFPQLDMGFTVTTHSADAALDGHAFSGTLRLISNSTDGTDPHAEADFFYFLERPDLGSCRVFDLAFQPAGNPGNVGTCAMDVRIGSLIPTAFSATSPAAFTNASTAPGPVNPVPEPGVLGLLAVGIVTAGVRKARRTGGFRGGSDAAGSLVRIRSSLGAE